MVEGVSDKRKEMTERYGYRVVPHKERVKQSTNCMRYDHDGSLNSGMTLRD